MAEAKTAEEPKTTKDTKEDAATKDAGKYGEVGPHWHELRSADVVYALPLPAPEVEEGEEPVEGGYVLHYPDDTEKEVSAEEFSALNLQPVSPNKRL